MSTSALQTELSPSWKLEVNRRVAAHRNRRSSSAAGEAAQREGQPVASSRAAAAAARVAARYASAPSYSEMLQEEARAAVRAAERASRAALEAQEKAQLVLEGLEMSFQAAPVNEHIWQTAVAEAPVAEPQWTLTAEPEPQASQPVSENWDRPALGVRWEEDLPVRSTEPAMARATRGAGVLDAPAGEWWETTRRGEETPHEEIQVVEADQPIHGNLIEFPRELVAARKARPRLAEYGAAVDTESQLSIFEVHPETLATEMEASVATAEAATWVGPEWSDIELDAEAPPEMAMPAAAAPRIEIEEARVLDLAPLSRRLLAVVVDGTLIAGAFMAAAAVAAMNASALPSLKAVGIGSCIALLVVAALYEALFFTLATATPGMRYANLGLSTFDDQIPVLAQRWRRLGAMVLSLLPVGLGMVWSVFDEEHLSWHDRLSATYLRRA